MMSFSADLPLLTDYAHHNSYTNQQHLPPQAKQWPGLKIPVTRLPPHSIAFSDPTPSASLPLSSLPLHTHVGTGDNDCEGATIEETAWINHQLRSSMSHLQLSEIEAPYFSKHVATSDWSLPMPDASSSGTVTTCNLFPGVYGAAPQVYSNSHSFITPSSPYSTASLYDDSPLSSPYLSSPDCYGAVHPMKPPRSTPVNDEDGDEEYEIVGGKPYARLIYEALLQAPGHCMMLRDIYEWFERNTTKPRESGTNGWQNSIRHNLSMNKVCYQHSVLVQKADHCKQAFENDKNCTVNSRGEPKKTTSVWYLSQDALQHGVQSTTRYRKGVGLRKPYLNGNPDSQRQKSGAKGGRAARRAARLRRLEQTTSDTWESTTVSDNLEPLNNLAHAATVVESSSVARLPSDPPTPSETFSFSPSLDRAQQCIPSYAALDCKSDEWGRYSNDYQDHDMLFHSPYETSFGSSC